MSHPLLNPESTHYQMVDGVEAIERLEQMYTKEELATWAKITAMKYRLRIANKDDINKEAVKINGYEAYYTYLTDERSHDDAEDSAAYVFRGVFDDTVKRAFAKGHGSVIPVDKIDEAASALWNCDKPVEETMYDAKTTSSKSNEEASEEVEETSPSDTVGGTEVGEDDKFLDVVEALQARIGGDAKVSIVGHREGNIIFAVEGCDPDQLPPSEELAEIIEKLRPSDSGRGTSMDRGLSETITALERLELGIRALRHGVLVGDTDTRNLREPISDVVTKFMVTMGKIRNGY